MAERAQVSVKKQEAKREIRPFQTQKAGPSQSISSPVEQILFLQRTIGNQAVGKLLKSGALQAKLRIGQPGDVYEQEADRVAEQVMRMPEPQVSNETKVSNPAGNNSIQRKCPGCKKGTKIENEEKLQEKEASGSTPEGTPELEYSISGFRVCGQPLPDSVRSFMEPRFGQDFSRVRVHSGAVAEQSARDVNAHAYTVGHDIVFGDGQFSPGTHEGQRLLAHESTHVVQQGGGNSRLQRDVDEVAVDQCIAELGGSTGFRDGGIASPEELERYRQECLARQAPTRESGSSRAIENLGRAWAYAKEELGAEVTREVENLFSPASLIAMAAFAVVYIASQLTPVGWIADALALLALSATVIFVGMLVIEIARDLYRFFSAVNATSDDELRSAGHALARALARGGVGIFIALLAHGMRGATRTPPPTAPATAMVEVVSVGVRVRMPVTATAGAAVDTSRLIGLASYAVMVPPPGGAEPSSPSSSSSSGGGSGRGRGTGSERGSESGGRGSSSEVAPAGGFRLGPITYGEGILSQLAQRMRLMLGLRRGGNVAVFEFENIPANFRSLVTRLGGRNVHVEGNRMAVQNVNGSAHSEQLAHMLITEGRRAGIELNVQRIYTEYNPCTNTCLPLIQRHYPRADVTFSFIWELWGRETPDRNAAVDALFGQAGSEGGRSP
jgi:uncharacterized membrane protein YgcG